MRVMTRSVPTSGLPGESTTIISEPLELPAVDPAPEKAPAEPAPARPAEEPVPA